MHAQVTHQIRRFLEFFRAERTRVPPHVSYTALLDGEIFPANKSTTITKERNIVSFFSIATSFTLPSFIFDAILP